MKIHPDLKTKLEKLEKLGFKPFATDFIRQATLKATHTNLNKLKATAFPIQLKASVAGRIKQLRRFKKLTFAVLEDATFSLQILFIHPDFDQRYQTLILNLDRGDLIGIKQGFFKYTKTNELTLVVKEFVLLTKVLQSLPEKYHSLTDVEQRYRQRYLDLIMNDQVYQNFRNRSRIMQLIHQFLQQKGFLSVETPILHPILGGANARPFKTFHNSLFTNFYLRVAPELYLKRLLVGRFEKVYEMGRLFRNEGLSIKHNPEFTALEVYQAYANMETMMQLVENLIRHLVNEMFSTAIIEYQSQKLNFELPFQRLTMIEAVKKYTGIDFTKINLRQAIQLATKHNLDLASHQKTVGHILNHFFENFVESKLIQPTFIYQYPVEISPLARSDQTRAGYTERFELFIDCREYANAFSELNDPREQLLRFEQQIKEREQGNEEANEIDFDYINALTYGFPPSGGLGVGIDRLIMLLTNQKSITDVILFPTLKPSKPKT